MHAQIPPIPCSHCGTVPHYKEREAQQAPYLGMFQALVARIRDTSPDVPIYQRDLNRWLNEIASETPAAVEARAVNTTIYGREDETC